MSTTKKSSKKTVRKNSRKKTTKAIKKSVKSTKRAVAVSKKVASKKSDKKNDARKIRGFAGNENHFYKGFPRALAYAILIKANNRTLTVGDFRKKILKLSAVKNVAAANGIINKLVGKPSDNGTLGTIAVFVS